MTLYQDSIAPHYFPSGGGFSITTFSLASLYELFQKARCWWTTSNDDLPLIRYLGCTIDLYKSDSSDYIFSFHNCPPMKATLETYQSTQPTMLLLTKNHHTVRCKKYNPYKKPYKRLHIRPPALFKNKWYFQKEIHQTPLLMTMCSATSLDRQYLASNSISTTVGFTSLNTKYFQFHNFSQTTTTGYHPKEGLYFYSHNKNTASTSGVTYQDLIYLGTCKDYTLGKPISTSTGTDLSSMIDNYHESSWGNIFHPDYLKNNKPVLTSTMSLTQLKSKTKTDQIGSEFTLQSEPNLIECRYNPLNDRGDQNQVYLVNINDQRPGWQTPAEAEMLSENIPIWLAVWGFLDFNRRKFGSTTIDTTKCIVFHTKYMEPKDLPQVCILDDDMLNGRSPYRPKDNITSHDRTNWRPKVAFQMQKVNEIGSSGPGTIKLPANVSCEGHIKFRFYFKLGGCAQEQKNIENPEDQPVFPTPGNLLRSTSLQNPATPMQNFLYSFDWRRDLLTQKAKERITKYGIPEISSIYPTEFSSAFIPQTSPQKSSEGESTEEEKEAETLQLLIHQQHLRQQRFKERILRLLTSTNLE